MIQSLLNNTSFSTTKKSLNEIVYYFTPKRLLDILMPMALLDLSVAKTAASDVIAFALMAYKNHYDPNHQLLFLKVGEYALLRLHKGYLILSTREVTKKLTPQYVESFGVL